MSAEASTEVVQTQNRLPVALTGNLALDEAMRLSQVLALSSLVPKDLRGKAPDVLAVLLYGQEIGLRPMQALQTIDIVEGRPFITAKLWLALVRRSGHQAKITAEDPGKSVSVWMKRGDDGTEHTETFTLDDAINAKYVSLKDGKPYARSQSGKSLPWEVHTKDMLRARAISTCARFVCPEVALGYYSEADAQPEFSDDEVAEVVAEQMPRRADVAPPLDPEVVVATLDDIEAELTLDVTA